MLWSPNVAKGRKTVELEAIAKGWTGPGCLDLRINGAYSDAMTALIGESSNETKQRGELFYRTLQLPTHLRDHDNKRLRLTLS